MSDTPGPGASIGAALPHRYPFLMVDAVVEAVPGASASALKSLTVDGFLTGGGVRDGQVPQTMVLEAMAQTAAFAATGTSGGGAAGGFLAALGSVVFKANARAGERLTMRLEFVAALGPMVRFRGSAHCRGELVVEADFTFTV